ncbi:MAG: TIGR02757 family protein [Ginsengibacter sp.]
MTLSTGSSLKKFLDGKVEQYNRLDFIQSDPVCIPHAFSKKQDIEIAGFFAALFAWGNRTTIINKSKELMMLMDNSPFQFCKDHHPKDLKKLMAFKHRTFNTTDLLYFISFLKFHFSKNKSLESAFFTKETTIDPSLVVENALNFFYGYFFSLDDVPPRTRKHIASPQKKSTCKRLNMYLRWMVRNDNKGVDFGIWKKCTPAQLICPVDVHVARVARGMKLLSRKATDWQAAMELTSTLRRWDKADPVKYDFALFALGVVEKY